MTKDILSTAQTNQYRLPAADREALLSQTDSALQNAQIERQRVAFVLLNGCDFGLEIATQ